MMLPHTPLLTDDRRDRYLERLGFVSPPKPTQATLGALHLAHLRLVPFENLDIHLGRRITIDVAAFVGKIVDQSRGGFCYELNGAFAVLLRTIGFEVTMHEARVHGTNGPTQPFDHLCLIVQINVPFLVDVGFGASFDEPIQIAPNARKVDAGGAFRLNSIDGEWWDLSSETGPQYRFSQRPRLLEDFAPGCEFHQSSASHFTTSTICSLRTSTGRITIRGNTLIETIAGERHESNLDRNGLDRALNDRFGINLDQAAIDGLHQTSFPKT